MVYVEDLPDGIGYDFMTDTCYDCSGGQWSYSDTSNCSSVNISSVNSRPNQTYYPGTDQWQSTMSGIDNFKHANEEQPSQGDPETVTTPIGQWLWRKVFE
jgi:hypothetical protein